MKVHFLCEKCDIYNFSCKLLAGNDAIGQPNIWFTTYNSFYCFFSAQAQFRKNPGKKFLAQKTPASQSPSCTVFVYGIDMRLACQCAV